MSRQIILALAAFLTLHGVFAFTSFGASDTDKLASAKVADDDVATGAMKFISWLGKFHPPATHFPIALIIAAAVAEVYFARSGKKFFGDAHQYCVWFGIIASLVTGTIGWFRGGFHLIDKNWLLTTHRWLGTSTVLCSLVLAFLNYRVYYRHEDALRRWYRLALGLAAILVSATGFFGGTLIYGINEFTW